MEDESTARQLVPALDHLAAAIITIGAYVVTPVSFAGSRIDRQRRRSQRIVRATLTTSRASYFTFLNGHSATPEKIISVVTRLPIKGYSSDWFLSKSFKPENGRCRSSGNSASITALLSLSAST